MLGAIEFPQRWQWVAFGKHPVARDFFRLGPDVTMLKEFSEWVESGYRGLLPRPSSAAAEFHSFRFWTKGLGKDGLVLGVVRDSSDDIGRPYPFLTMGSGPLKAWEEHWDLLPLACEMSWGRIEYLSSGAVQDYRRMEIEVSQRLIPPVPDWEVLLERRRAITPPGSDPDGAGSCMDLREMKRQAMGLSGEAEIFLSLDAARAADHGSAVAMWNFLLRECGAPTPKAVFVGGALGSPCLAMFCRALAPSDFGRLWKAPCGTEGAAP